MPAPEGNQHAKFKRLVEQAQKHRPATTAIAHPCDQVSLESAVEARKMKLIEPILVGQKDKIAKAAGDAAIDLGDIEIVDAAHSHDAAAKAVALVREGRAEALMKGSLHTDELMAAVVARDTGLRAPDPPIAGPTSGSLTGASGEAPSRYWGAS